jgi:hypothetical protein
VQHTLPLPNTSILLSAFLGAAFSSSLILESDETNRPNRMTLVSLKVKLNH